MKRKEPVPGWAQKISLQGVWPICTAKGFWIAAEGSENLAEATQTGTPGQSRSKPFNFLSIDVYAQDHLIAGAVIGNTSSFGASGEVLLVQHFFHFAHELRGKEWFFQNVCSVLDQFAQPGKFVSKASDK